MITDHDIEMMHRDHAPDKDACSCTGCGGLWPCINERARRVADEAPPLTHDQQSRLLVLLRPTAARPAA